VAIRLLLASNNQHKIRELRDLLDGDDFEVLAPEDLDVRLEVEETGESFAENAVLKAESFSARTGLLSLADDSGLMVDALGGDPGFLSARYGGKGLTDDNRNQLVLSLLRGVPRAKRTARFVAAIAVATPGQTTRVFEGVVEGLITEEPRGSNGFGYDPIFFYPPFDRTFGEDPGEREGQKRDVSHRALALRAAVKYLTGMQGRDILV